MPFQIKSFNDITLAQINHARAVTDKITDFQPGSVVRTLMEAPAVEVEELYLQMLLGLRDAIPEATFRSFGFGRLPAARAHGFASVSHPVAPAEDIEIPAGSEFSTADGRTYLASTSITWLAGTNSVRIPIQYTVAGLIGNAAADVIVSSPLFDDTYTIGNSAIETGRDVEKDREREARFAEFVQALSRGTVVACAYSARSSVVLDEDGNIYEYVTRLGLVESPGYVRIYLYSSRGIPSVDLINDGQRRINGYRDEVTGAITPGYRAGGVRIDVISMVERAISASFSVGMFPGNSLSEIVKQRLGDVFATAIRGVQPGETLNIGTLVEIMLGVAGVQSVVPSINENIVCAEYEALIPGVLNINPL